MVNVYSHRHYPSDRELYDRFTEETGIEVNVVTGSADQLITRLETEGQGSPADVLITVDAGRLHRARSRGLLQPVSSDTLEARVPARLRHPEGYWYGLTRRALILPLAVPAFVAAYTYAGMFDVTGPLQQAARALIPGLEGEFLYLDVMGMGPLVVIFALVLYPYVYLTARASFHSHSSALLEASRVLGSSHAGAFFRVGMPLARPAVVAGVALVLMEVLNDYGAVVYYGVPTFTSGIFRAWFGLGDLDAGFLGLTANSFALAAAAAAICVALGLLIAYAVRLGRSRTGELLSRVAVLGYSIPGAVIAVGVLLLVQWLDGALADVTALTAGAATRVLLSVTAASLVSAYAVRFMAIAFSTVEAGFDRLCADLDEAARTLGAAPLETLLRVDLPLLRTTLVAAGTLVFVDVVKELPLTLILRPFDFDTLATTAFQMAMDEQIAESASAALLVQAGPPEDVYARPYTEYVARLFGPVNVLRARRTGAGDVESPVGTLSPPPDRLHDERIRVCYCPEDLEVGESGRFPGEGRS